MQETLKANLTTAEAQYNKMVNTSVGKLISKLAIPTVISMLITSVYNLADTYFINRLPIFYKSKRTVAYIKELKGVISLGIGIC